jgi:hypothetical protein
MNAKNQVMVNDLLKTAAKIQHAKAQQLAHQMSVKAVSKAAKKLEKLPYVFLRAT